MNRIPLTTTRRQLLLGTAAGAASLALPSFAQQAYPSRPVRWIVPYVAGGASDVVARVICQGLGDAMGQRFFVDNRPGAGGTIGTQAIASAAPDGYTLGTADNGSLYNNWSLFPKLSYTPDSFEYVAMTGRFPLLLAISSKVPAKDFRQWQEWAKQQNSNVSFASPGVGSPHHIAMALLEDRLGLKMQHVPYKGDAAAILDLIGGQVESMLVGVASASQYAKDERIRFLAVTWGSRLGGFPEVPTFDEVGIANFDMAAEQGILMPAGTPREVVMRINQEVGKVLNTAAVREKLETLGMYPVLKSPDEFKAYVQQQARVATELIKRKGITIG